MKPFVFKIGGEAGYGIMSTGLAFSKVAARSGYFVYNYAEYPSLIRGGHNVMQVAVGKQKVFSAFNHTDFLVALNQETVDRHIGQLSTNGTILYDRDSGVKLKSVPKGVRLLPLPINRLAREVGGTLLMRNTVALGASLAALGGDLKILKKLISEEFAKKGREIIDKNIISADAGYNSFFAKFKKGASLALRPLPKRSAKMVLTGNDAVALGAIAAGMQFASIYPMTPTSNILAILAIHEREFGFVYKQPEDEISAINMAIGASFAGARSMVATSGGGFSLMVEGYGLAGMTETPVVIIEGMRPGPATGLPTWTEQGDLRFMLHSHQGDFPRIILAPGDIEECFYLTMEAFNLADIYQTPVVVMVDKMLCESFESIAPFNISKYRIDRGKIFSSKSSRYKRYALCRDGISPRSFPGLGNLVVANSDEHNEAGYSAEDGGVRRAQMEKRMRKMDTCRKKSMAPPKLYGPRRAALTIVSWGSNKGAILEALKNFNNVNFLHLTWINPFPATAVKKILSGAKKILNVEGNYTGQMRGYIAEQTGINIKYNLLKYDGRPIFPDEVAKAIRDLI